MTADFCCDGRVKERFLAVCLISLLVAGRSFAGSATWNLNPISGDWNTADNWTPATVPNGPSDVATFDDSSLTQLSLSARTTVDSIVFASGANAFTINVGRNLSLTLDGAGFVNNSGGPQSLINHTPQVEGGVITFTGDASAGNLTAITNGNGASTEFHDNSTAGSTVITNLAADAGEGLAGSTTFFDFATAGNGAFVNNGYQLEGNGAFGGVAFRNASTGGNAIFTFGGGGAANAHGANVVFVGQSSADHGMFTLNGATAANASGSFGDFEDTATAGDGIFTVNGGSLVDAGGAEIEFLANSTAGAATIIVNGGIGKGGSCQFGDEATGGTARIELFDNGNLTIFSQKTLTIGSLEGNGIVNLGAQPLSIGTNNLTTTFSGVIAGSAGVAKVGTGSLNLSGANTYGGVTTISAGTLRVTNRTGSATGTGTVNVNAGTLGGRGTIAGASNIGTGSGAGAFLTPSIGASQPSILTIQSLLTFKADSTYTYKLNTKEERGDQVSANGVTIQSGAQFSFNGVSNKRLHQGQTFTAILNISASPISGTFANLADGSTFTAGRNKFQASYSGGDGNDLTLTVVQ